jgi:hypothetical protein
MTTKEIVADLNLTSIGEEISHDVGAKMVKDFQDANPNSPEWFFVGKNILAQILAQPGCVGIRQYNAINEEGVNTFVQVGVDADGKDISSYAVVGANGELLNEKGIVASKGPWSWLNT